MDAEAYLFLLPPKKATEIEVAAGRLLRYTKRAPISCKYEGLATILLPCQLVTSGRRLLPPTSPGAILISLLPPPT